MEPFVTRIGDVTIERVVPRTGKEPKESIPAPSVSLAKRVPGGSENESDTINVSEDLQIFLKPPAGDGKDPKKSETLPGKDEPDSVDSVKSGGDTAKMSTDEEGCDEDSESEDLRREEIDKTESDVNAKNGGDNLRSFRTDAKNDGEEDSEAGAEELGEEKTSDDKERQSETIGIEDSAVSKTEDGCDNTPVDNSGEKAESNKRKASLESSSNSGGSQKKKKKRRRRKTRSSEKEPLTDGSGEQSMSSSSESEDGEEEQSKPSVERKVSNLRRNIREVMDESQLDEETLAAQRQEMERLRRVQEQQRIIREVQRQIALNKQNTKTQTRVISLLQGNSSILKQIPGTSTSSSSSSTSGGTQVRLPNTVLVKLASGSASNTSTQTKKVYELLRVQKGAAGRGSSPSGRAGHVRAVPGKSRSPGQVHMMTPSVSIAPVMSAQSSQQGSDSESDLGEGSDKDVSSSGGVKTSGKPKGKDVVTISSSSDDDDCILLSEPSSGDEGDPVDDPTNSGMHTNDLYNVPDDQGRVLVNVGHPPEEPDIFLAPQIARVIKAHQIGGVRFLYDNVVESVERFNTSTGFGCILAHSMGLGKTLQVVSFCDVFLRHTKARTVLCIMPINTLQNWLAEFNMWLPEKDPQNSPLAVHGEVRPREFPLHVLNDSHKSMTARSKVIQEWNKDGGVLLIGYELYRQLSLRRTHKSKKKRKKMLEVVDVDEEDKNKALLDDIHSALVKPGPDLVICDEGHRIKNSHASISQALKQIRSKRRVVLTGYPLQNNLLEYWCMVDFVRPNYLGTKTEFCNMFERPIQNGQCIDSTPQDIRLMRYRAHVLHSLLEGFVQRRSHSVLQVSLPQKEEYVLLLRMTAFQRKLYDTFMNEVVRTKAVPNPLKAFAVCCKIWNHPDVLYYFLKKRTLGEDVDLDLEETTAASTPMTPRNGASPAAPKRGRGRTPRSTSGSKRDKKGNGQNGSAGRKPAATIIPNNTNMNVESSGMAMPGGMSGMGHNPHGQMPNMGAPQPQMQPSLPHQQNQGFNTLGHQNQSYNRDTAPYHDMYHQNIPQGSGSSYTGHGYSGSGYGQSNSSSSFGGMETHNYGEGHHTAYDCSSGGTYYQSTNVRDQGNYNPYYGNNQSVNNDNSFQCNPSNSNYWHTNHSSYYQQNVHSDSTNAGSRTNQYYGSSTGSHYGNSDQSYYMNHQQNQNQNFGGQMNGNMYHSMGTTEGYGNNMGHMHSGRGQQTQMEEQSEQRMRNSQSMLGAQTHQMGSVSTHMGTGHGQLNNCPPGMQGQNMTPNQNMTGQTMNQNMQGQSMHNSGVPGQTLHNQGMQGQNLQNQVMQNQNLQNQGMQSQNLQNQGMQGQNLQNQGMQGQNLQNQNISNQGHQGQNIQNQGMHGQNMANSSMHAQNMPNQNMQGQAMANQVLQNQNLSGQGMQGQTISGQTLQTQGMQGQSMQNQSLQSSKQNVMGGGMSGQSQNMENQNMSGQLSTNHNQLGNPNQLGKSPNSSVNCGNQISSSGQLSSVQSIEKMSQMCNSPTQSRGSMPPQTSPLGTQKAVMSGNHGNSGSTSSVNDGQGNLQPMIHSQLDPIGAMQNSGHINQGLNDMQNQINISVPYHNSGGTAEVNSSQQTWHYGHQGMQGDNRNSSCGSYDPMDSYTNSGRLCDVKPDVRKMSSTHSDPLCEMGSMYNRFPTKDEKQENSDQWGSGEIPTEQNVLNAAVKCDPGDNFENSSEVKSTVKSESSCSMSVRALSPQDSSQSQSMLTSPNKNLSEDSSSLNDKSEIDKECEQSQLVTQCSSPSGKSTFGNGAQTDAKGTESERKCTDINQEGQDQKVEAKSQMTDASCISPNSERCEEKNKDTEALPEDTKVVETEQCTKNMGSGTDTGEEGNKDVTDKNASDVKPCTDPQSNMKICTKEDPGIPYDWATELLKNYVPGSIENSAKMEVFFCILEESMALGDRMLVFSQSLFTLNLIEDFLQRSNLPGSQEKWSRNWNYYRLDGSTSALEREKLINEYNSNSNIHLFLVSTRAGSLGINLVGANRVVVFDASWNPCHDTQAVCRVYRYGQKKPCFVYRLVMDNCLEKKIYDRQINKQGMADRVVDECNPDAHLSIKEVTNLCWDNEEETEVRDFSKEKHKYIDVVMQKVLDKHSALLTKEPFQHESLLVDRKEKKLSQAEKRLAKRSYELEKQANINYNRPQYSYYPSSGVCNSGMQTSLQIRAIRTDGTGNSMVPKPVASVRPMQAELNSQVDRTLRTSGALNSSRSRWIPADVWQRQGMSAQEMTLPLDVVIPTNSPDRASIVLKAGQRVMVLKSPKGIYMQLENGKIIAIRTAFKVGGSNKGGASQDYKNTLTSNIDKADLEMKPVDVKKEGGTPNSNRGNIKVNSVLPLKNNSAITIIPKISPASNMNRSGGNANKPPVNKITPTNIKQEPNCRTNWSSNSKLSHSKGSDSKSGTETKSYFQMQNQSQRSCVEDEFEDNDSNDQQQSSSSKAFYPPEGEGKGGSNTHSSFSDDGSSSVTNLMMDDKENSNLTEGEIMIKSPSQDYQNPVGRKEDEEEEGEQILETSHDGSPKETERENQNFSQAQGSSQENVQQNENPWQQADKSNASYDTNKNQKGSSPSEGDFQNYSSHTGLSQQNTTPNPPSHSVPPVQHQTAHHSVHSSPYHNEFRQMHDDTSASATVVERRQETPLSTQPLQQHEYNEETRETPKQDVNMSTSYTHKNVCHLGSNTNSSDTSSVSQNHPHFMSEHHKSMMSSDNTNNTNNNNNNNNNNKQLREDEVTNCGNQPVAQSHSYTENTLKSPSNYHNTLDNSANSYGAYKHDGSNTSSNMMEPNKNVIRSYHETNITPVTGDLRNDGRGKCDLHKRENCECESSRNSTKIKISEAPSKSNASNQQYLPPPSSHAQSSSQVSDSVTPSKKRQSSKSVTPNSETMTSDCTARYNMENPHMKAYSNSSSLETQHSNQSSSLTSSTFPASTNLSSESYQMPLHNPHASATDSHSTDYPHVGNLKSLPQPPPAENVYGSSYSQYLGGPTYYGFGQQTTPSMMQFGNHYYGDNQYERPLTSSDQNQNKERNISHSIGRSDTHALSSSLATSKKETNHLNSGDTRELKQDSKSSLCVREEVRTSGSPGSASGSHSNNNSARSTPAINQTPVSSSSTEPASNCNPSLPSALPSVPPANFNPYASGSSTSTASLSTHQNPYESMMLNSYTPGTCQYNIPGSSAASTTVPFTAPGSNYGSPLRPTAPASAVSPYGTPTAYGGSMSYGAGVSSQYDTDYARASMYSAFHRPEPHHFAPAPAELAPPFLPSVAPPTNPSPFSLSSHHRSPHFPSSPGASSQNSNYYPQNMYAPSPYPSRPGYTATDAAYAVPYGTPTPTFSPFLNHHLHQHPYSTLQHPGSAPPPGPQSTGASPVP
ncbi:Uncharacterized protein GBIM_10708 [Gryllus bimaculatus]|nr:Uncharacterized protein GBIM_10708 [Gryllus bimaculatus]